MLFVLSFLLPPPCWSSFASSWVSHMLLPSPRALSLSSFHPAGLGISLLPEHLSQSHPLKFSFPIMVSFPIVSASSWHWWLLSPSVLTWFSIVGSPARLEGSRGKKGLSVGCSVHCHVAILLLYVTLSEYLVNIYWMNDYSPLASLKRIFYDWEKGMTMKNEGRTPRLSV